MGRRRYPRHPRAGNRIALVSADFAALKKTGTALGKDVKNEVAG